MCTIFKNKPSEIKTGYKVLALDTETKKLYSSFTGQEFNIGKVPLPPEYCKRIGAWNDDLDYNPLADCLFYKSDYAGFSSAFKYLMKAIKFKEKIELYHVPDNIKIIIALVEFDGEVYCCDYNNDEDIIAGNYVKSIKIL